jgi:hypothetical protein
MRAGSAEFPALPATSLRTFIPGFPETAYSYVPAFFASATALASFGYQ